MAVAETVWVLKSVFGYDDKLVTGLVEKLITHKNINCSEALFKLVLDSYMKPPKTSFVDVCLAFYTDLRAAKLLTFDKTLAKKFPSIVKLL
jgi:predicted nucleic-acid-binding protein